MKGELSLSAILVLFLSILSAQVAFVIFALIWLLVLCLGCAVIWLLMVYFIKDAHLRKPIYIDVYCITSICSFTIIVMSLISCLCRL